MKLKYMTIFEEQVVCKKENIHSNITWLINEIRVYSVWHLYELFTFYSQKVNEKVNFAILIINNVMSMNIMQQKKKKTTTGINPNMYTFVISWYGTMFWIKTIKTIISIDVN